MHLRRILMNAADKSPGSGAPPPTPPTPGQNPPPTTPAEGGAPPAGAPANGAVTLEAIQGMITAGHDKIFADLRRAGVLGSTTPKPTPKPTPAPSGDPNAAPAAAPAPDISELRALDRALTRSGRTNLDEAAYRRLERSYVEERPANAEQWVTDYFQGFGVPVGGASSPAQTPATPAPAGTPAAAPNGQPPASNRGAPAAPQVPLEEQSLLTMSAADRAALIKSKGLKVYTEMYAKQVGGMTIKTR